MCRGICDVRGPSFSRRSTTHGYPLTTIHQAPVFPLYPARLVIICGVTVGGATKRKKGPGKQWEKEGKLMVGSQSRATSPRYPRSETLWAELAPVRHH